MQAITSSRWFFKPGTQSPHSNPRGIGARVKVSYSGGVGYRQQTGGGGGNFESEGSQPLHFEIGTATAATVEVKWPSGIIDTLPSVTANTTLTVVEGSAPTATATATPTPTSTPTPSVTPTPTPPSITVTSPNGGETWIKGTTQTITWTDNISGNVRILLLYANTTAAIIAAHTANTGSFDWTVPTSLATGNNFVVKIDSVDDRTINDKSDRAFRIR